MELPSLNTSPTKVRQDFELFTSDLQRGWQGAPLSTIEPFTHTDTHSRIVYQIFSPCLWLAAID